jgi:hypothetical protein
MLSASWGSNYECEVAIEYINIFAQVEIVLRPSAERVPLLLADLGFAVLTSHMDGYLRVVEDVKSAYVVDRSRAGFAWIGGYRYLRNHTELGLCCGTVWLGLLDRLIRN